VDTEIRTGDCSEVIHGKGSDAATSPTFSPQFKKDAVRLVTEEGKSLTEVATHLGIARSLLQRWWEQVVSKPVAEVFPSHR
jgi:transposase-like protein